MKQFFYAFLLIAFSVTFSACPYDSSVPIDSPSVKVDAKLFGTWKTSDSEDTRYKIDQKDDYTYSVLKKTKGSSDEKYLAYVSVINGINFLNVCSDDADNASSKTFYLYRMEIKGPETITLMELTENIDEEFNTSEELKKFIASNMGNSYFYEKSEEILTKQ